MLIATSDKNELRLYDGPCSHAPTLDRLKPEWRHLFKQANADMGGKSLVGCWISLLDDDAIYVLIDGADGFALGVDVFKVERGI